MPPAAALILLALATLLASCATQLPKPVGHWAEVNGHALWYEIGGTSTDKTPILLLHGGGSSIRGSFRHQLAAFGKDHRLIAIEQVGQGHTPDVDGPLTYTKMMEDTAALLVQLHLPPVDAVGYSDGGNIALLLALRHPELVRRIVTSGANLDPSGLHADDLEEMRNSAPDELQKDDDESSDDPDSADNEHVAVPIEEKLRQLWLYSPTPDELTPDLLHGIKQRVLVMAGSHDAIRRDHTMLIERSLPDARLLILPHTGHSTFSSRPHEVNAAVLAFLDQP